MGFWDTLATVTGNSLLDRLCRESGWSIDERSGKGIGLHFKGDHVTPQRTVYVFYEEGKPIMGFNCFCRAEYSDQNLPSDLMAALLVRNKSVTAGAWQANIDDGTLRFSLQHLTLAAGVNAHLFRTFCTLMVEEVAQVEAIMRRKGML
jgi:hypothetical protein